MMFAYLMSPSCFISSDRKPKIYFRPSLQVMSKTFAAQRPAPNPVQIEPAHMHVGMSVGHGLLLHSCRGVELGRPEANVTQI
jgi:hypothetical protein